MAAPLSFEAAGEIGEAVDVGQHTLAAFAEGEAGVRASGLQQLVDGIGDGPVVPPAMQFAQQVEGLADGSELGIEIGGKVAHGMEAAVLVAKVQEGIVEHGIEAAAQDGEHAQLVIGPLDGAERGAQGADFFAQVEGLGADEQVRNAARFERSARTPG